jgi:hypothetical protein
VNFTVAITGMYPRIPLELVTTVGTFGLTELTCKICALRLHNFACYRSNGGKGQRGRCNDYCTVRMNRGSDPDRVKNSFSSTKRSPASFLRKRAKVPCRVPNGRGGKSTIHFRLVSRLRMDGAVSPLTYMFLCSRQEQLRSSLFLNNTLQRVVLFQFKLLPFQISARLFR